MASFGVEVPSSEGIRGSVLRQKWNSLAHAKARPAGYAMPLDPPGDRACSNSTTSKARSTRSWLLWVRGFRIKA